MKWLVLALFIVACSLALAEETDSEEKLPGAEPCDEKKCKLPDCLCSSTDIPAGLTSRQVPQFVLITFDDSVSVTNIDSYRDLLYDRTNSNGCPAGATFYVSHEHTNYQLVNELYNRGFEIALNSITHQTPQTYWAEASYEDMTKEFADQITQMSFFANIPAIELKGIRLPFLQLAGNSSFQMIKNHDLVYDSSWPTVTYTDPPLWPYTLDYESIQDCVIGPCPEASLPGVWVQPIVTWRDPLGYPCSTVDACFAAPDREDVNAWFQYILENFERHYLGNRAPFSFNIRQWYLAAFPAVREAMTRFLNLINNLEDVFMVNANEVIEWVKDPVPIDEYKKQSCRTYVQTSCPDFSCGPYVADHNGLQYWLQLCNWCPSVYPWLGNPLGQTPPTK